MARDDGGGRRLGASHVPALSLCVPDPTWRPRGVVEKFYKARVSGRGVRTRLTGGVLYSVRDCEGHIASTSDCGVCDHWVSFFRLYRYPSGQNEVSQNCGLA